MSPRPPQLPDELAGRAFRIEEARAAGLTRWKLDGPAAHRVHRGIYVDAAAPNTLEARCAAALLAMPSGSIISHHTAAALRGLPAPKSAEIHVRVPGRPAPRVAGIRAHLGAGGAPVETYKGLLITPRPRLWLDLAAELDRVELIVLGDAILRPESVTPEDLQAAIDAAGGRRGVQVARAVFPFLELRVDSPQETRLRMILIDGGLPRPVVNQPIFDSEGEWIGCPDLKYVDERVPIEYEGAHHFTKEQAEKDIRRDELYRDEGHSLIRVVARDLKRPKLLVARVARQLELGRARHSGRNEPAEARLDTRG